MAVNDFPNVNVSGVDPDTLNEEEQEVLFQQMRYCQAMTDADLDTLRELVQEEKKFTHMSGMQQTRDEYFCDIQRGRLNYFTIGIDSPKIQVNDDRAEISYTAILNADAYGARGTFRMRGTHYLKKENGQWRETNGGDERHADI